MSQGEKLESRKTRRVTFKPNHSEPGAFHLDYILLPFGTFYDKTNKIAEAKKGDKIRFFNGPEYLIDNVSLIKQDKFCDILCRMRYGIPWQNAFAKWQSYARMEGYGKDILSTEECILVVYEKDHK